MGSVRYRFLLFLASTIFSATDAQKTVNLPVRKDSKKLQYFTTFQLGSNQASVNAVVDLGADFMRFDCDNYTSNSYAPIPCYSAKCNQVKVSGCILVCEGPRRLGCTNNTCGSFNYNPIEGVFVGQGLYEDTLSTKDHARLPKFLFSCNSDEFFQDLATGATSTVGLARTEISLHKQITRGLNLPDKFSLCLPSSGLGKLSFGEVLSPSKSDVSHLLKPTPLIVNPVSISPVSVGGDPSVGYFIDVKSIKVHGQPLSVNDSYFSIDKNGNGGTKISTIQNYTALHRSIHIPFTLAFVKAAADMKIKSVAAVAPFRACFSSNTISKTGAGPRVPTIDLVLPGTDVYWRISGANSMVEIDRNTMCLAFVDTGPKPRFRTAWPRTSIIIGTHQLEDNLLVFDLASSQLKFSSSLLTSNKSCSHL